MTEAAPALSYPFQGVPHPGHATEIKPGVLWLRMPLPFALDHINLWALSDGSGWTVVDTGIRSVEVRNAWMTLLSPAGPLAGRPISRVMATHMHPDHVGMAGWLTRRFDSALWMTRDEYLSCRAMLADTGREAPIDGVRFYQRAGWSEAEVDEYRTRFGDFGKMIHPLPDSFVRLTDGQMLQIGGRGWEVIVGTGHSPEHACFYSRELDLLISGDQVLPRISSNTSVYPTEPQANPLQGWLDSIERLMQRVPDSALVLPAHNEPFHGLHVRLEQLRASTLRGTDRVRQQLTQPLKVIDLVRSLYRSSVVAEQMHLNLATGETLAHLNYLAERGEIVATEDEDGSARYRLA
ncbi:MBL fold metallo-hydrolase [Cupriavidus necator]|uniref:MBL fold metallo-hydrolase n=1 Tax=Cupriavidus necator TaxID=106590 RepID=UPI0039C3E45F